MKKAKHTSLLALALSGLLMSAPTLAASDAGSPVAPETRHTANAAGVHDARRNENAAPVSIAITLKKNNKILAKFFVRTLDGITAPIGSSTQASYTSKATRVGNTTVLDTRAVDLGVGLKVTPDLTDDGRIHLALVLTKRTLTAIDTIHQSGADIQLPQITSFTLDQQMMLEDGKPATVLVGGDVQSGYSVTVTASRV